jgi:hypothetical protein
MDPHTASDRGRRPPQPDVVDRHGSPTNSTKESTLRVLAWRDDLARQATSGLATASDATLLYWTPVLGPTGSLLLHRLATLASADPDATTTVEDLARMLGVGPHKLNSAIRRLERHDLITCTNPATVAVRLSLPALTDRQRRQLPDPLAARYQAEATPRTAPPTRRPPTRSIGHR